MDPASVAAAAPARATTDIADSASVAAPASAATATTAPATSTTADPASVAAAAAPASAAVATAALASTSNGAADPASVAAAAPASVAPPSGATAFEKTAAMQRPPVDQSDWGKSQKDLYALMIRKPWGVCWEELIKAMCDFEASKLWWDDRFLTNVDRPHEIGQWMKEHRRAIDYAVEADFGERLLAWWRACGPAWRRKPRPANIPEDQEWPPKDSMGHSDEWAELTRSGKNGIQLMVWGLMWWGQAIVNKHAVDGLGGGEAALALHKQWQYMLGDLLWVYSCITIAPDPDWLADIKKEAEAEVQGKKEKGNKRKKAGGKKQEAEKPSPIGMRQSVRSRKREQDQEQPDEAPAAKRQEAEPTRPRPQPRVREKRSISSGATKPVTTGDASRETAGDLAIAPIPTASPGPQPKQVAQASQGNSGALEDPFAAPALNEDPFANDPTAGMTEEERADYEAEMVIDPFADEDG
ncbi:hypothetical protein GGX14DRAFT_564911 [Mycena pura]|uniref:Uncharacterized protein n=1 Tax=Mycena pura TaxID=153505 RepID=A0AAD6VJV2_9AGAR|nr:hypothetical protein GGX14DRAFT_564911 [Mycena pura]